MDDLDLVVVGGGTAGLTGAVLAAGLGARVALVERDRTGGECLWTGCVPSKGLIEAANLVQRMRTAATLGLPSVEPDVELPRVLEHVRGAQAQIAPHDSPERLEELGVRVIHGDARLTPAGDVLLAGGGRFRPRSVLVATGSQPSLADIEGLTASAPLTTDSVWELTELPERLVVLGAGPVGCELAQAFARLGAAVTLIEVAAQLLPGEDPDVGALLAERFRVDGIDVRTGARCVRIDDDKATIATGHGEEQVPFDRMLVATGRRPRTAGLGLEEAGARVTATGAVEVDRRLRTSARGIYAAGDVTGVLPFTHVAAYQAGVATLNALFGLRRRADYRHIPWVVFTDPEVARVGLTETGARRRWGTRAIVARYDYEAVDRAVAAAAPYGFATLVGSPRGRLVGATVAAPAAGEVIAELAALVARGARVGDIFRTIHPYPTFALGPAMAGGEHLRDRWLSERTRRIARPLLAARRVLGRRRWT